MHIGAILPLAPRNVVESGCFLSFPRHDEIYRSDVGFYSRGKDKGRGF